MNPTPNSSIPARVAWLREDFRAPHEFRGDVAWLREHRNSVPEGVALTTEAWTRFVDALLARWDAHEAQEAERRAAQEAHRAAACRHRDRTLLPVTAGLFRMGFRPFGSTRTEAALVHVAPVSIANGWLTVTLLDPMTLERRELVFALDGAGRTLVPNRGWEVLGFDFVL